MHCGVPAPDRAALLALFLTVKTGTCLGVHEAYMTSIEQRALMGRVLGRGRIVIDGSSETVCNRVKVCFGLDFDDRNVVRWKDL